MRTVRVFVPALALAAALGAASARAQPASPGADFDSGDSVCRILLESAQNKERQARAKLSARKAFLYRLAHMGDKQFAAEYARVQADYAHHRIVVEGEHPTVAARNAAYAQREETRQKLNVMSKSRERVALGEKIDPVNDRWVREGQKEVDAAVDEVRRVQADCGGGAHQPASPDPSARPSASPTPVSTPSASPRSRRPSGDGSVNLDQAITILDDVSTAADRAAGARRNASASPSEARGAQAFQGAFGSDSASPAPSPSPTPSPSGRKFRLGEMRNTNERDAQAFEESVQPNR